MPPISSRPTRSLIGAALLALPLLFGCGSLTLRGFFVDSAYPKRAEPMPARDVELVVNASVVPSLIVDYERPAAAASCLAQLAQEPETIAALTAYGRCRAEGQASAACYMAAPWIPTRGPAGWGAWGARRHGQPGRLRGALSCPSQLESKLDQVRMYLSLAETAEAAFGYHLDTRGQAAVEAPFDAELSQALTSTLEHASAILGATPTARRDPTLPTLALSGGAANGAFMAGYAYGLLWQREKALLYATPEQREAIEGYRMGGAATSSVGTLVALALDLYFSEQTPNAKEASALRRCIEAGGAPVSGQPGRLAQDCGLAQLRVNFRQDEWDLLCAQKGTVLDLVGSHFTGLLRFDPLQENILEPFFKDFQRLLLNNGFIRTAMAVEMNQGVLGGLDERACRLPGMDTQRCLVSASLASIIEPIFAAPLDVVYSGLRGAAGERGTWLDGSMRSMNPAGRAAAFGSGQVLALNPARAQGIPSVRVGPITEQFLHTADTLAASQRGWELGFAKTYLTERREDACTLKQLTGNGSLCPAPSRERRLGEPQRRGDASAWPRRGASAPRGASAQRGARGGLNPARAGARALPASDPGGQLLAVWVPEDIEPKTLFASGYTFDPLVMSALFAWGQQQALTDRHRVFSWLGWCALSAMEDGAVSCPTRGASPRYRQAIQDYRRELRREIDGYRKYADLALWQKHLDERRRDLSKHFKTCK